jgi:hypothetical protein
VRFWRAWILVGLIVTSAGCSHQQSSSQATEVQASPSIEASGTPGG